MSITTLLLLFFLYQHLFPATIANVLPLTLNDTKNEFDDQQVVTKHSNHVPPQPSPSPYANLVPTNEHLLPLLNSYMDGYVFHLPTNKNFSSFDLKNQTNETQQEPQRVIDAVKVNEELKLPSLQLEVTKEGDKIELPQSYVNEQNLEKDDSDQQKPENSDLLITTVHFGNFKQPQNVPTSKDPNEQKLNANLNVFPSFNTNPSWLPHFFNYENKYSVVRSQIYCFSATDCAGLTLFGLRLDRCDRRSATCVGDLPQLCKPEVTICRPVGGYPSVCIEGRCTAFRHLFNSDKEIPKIDGDQKKC